jgi:hypothetical protein
MRPSGDLVPLFAMIPTKYLSVGDCCGDKRSPADTNDAIQRYSTMILPCLNPPLSHNAMMMAI